MPSVKSIIFSILSIAPLVLSQPDAEPSTVVPDTLFDFQALLNALPAESLHVALHKHANDKYQDGVYEHDRLAVEKVHKEDPGTATKVLAEAALHLIKRQNNETTTTETTTSTTTQGGGGGGDASTTKTTASTSTIVSTTSTSTQTNVIIPVEVATTDSKGSTTTLTTSAVVSATVSVVQAVTTTNSKGSTVVASTTVAAAVVTQADGKVTTSPVPVYVNTPAAAATTPQDVTTTDSHGATVVLSSVTPSQVITTTDALGSTFVTTFTPGGGSVSSLVIKTSTLPDGQATTITSFAVVAADTAAPGPSSSTGPHLQNGGDSFRSRSFGAEAIAIVGGAFGVALFL